MGNVIQQYQILTQGIVDNTKQVGLDPIDAGSSFYEAELLAYHSAGTSNILKQAVTNELIIVGIALTASANTLNALVGSSDLIMGTVSSTQLSYYKSIDLCPFEANLTGKVLAQNDMGAQYGITRTALTVGAGPPAACWSIDSSKTSASSLQRVTIVGFQNTDNYHGGIGDTNARVIAKVIASYSFWYATGGGEF